MNAFVDTLLGDLAIVGKLVVALVLSGAMGWEREQKNRSAGLRTHMLVGMASAMFVAMGIPLVDNYARWAAEGGHDELRFDPLRIVEAVVAGVSFLGAGTIFVSGKNVHGLTTAASILATSAVGMSVALGHYALAVFATILVLIVLAIVRRVVQE